MLQRMIVLNYHQVPEECDSLRPDEIDRLVFRQQLKTLRRYFNVMGLGDAIDAMRAGTLPSRAVAITFDDGYRNNHDVALEELTDAGLSATFFIATDYLDGGRMWNDTLIESLRLTRLETLPLEDFGLEGALSLASNSDRITAINTLIPTLKHAEPEARQAGVERLASLCGVTPSDKLMMTSAQVKNLAEAGMEIGGHTASHPILLKLSDSEAFNDIKRGRDVLTQLLGTAPRFFAYPNGKLHKDYRLEHTEMLPELGFDAAFSTQWGYVTSAMPEFELPRVGFERNTGLKLVLKTLRSFFDTPTRFARRD